jgi:nucleotide-binding universal stress UspA family protein
VRWSTSPTITTPPLLQPLNGENGAPGTTPAPPPSRTPLCRTWQDPAKYGTAYGWTSAAFEGDTYATTMVKVLDDTVAEVAAHMPHPVAVLAQVIEGHPAEALVRAAAGAELLVVGSRGHGTFASIMLGSVSQHCVQHATCPVVVVR